MTIVCWHRWMVLQCTWWLSLFPPREYLHSYWTVIYFNFLEVPIFWEMSKFIGVACSFMFVHDIKQLNDTYLWRLVIGNDERRKKFLVKWLQGTQQKLQGARCKVQGTSHTQHTSQRTVVQDLRACYWTLQHSCSLTGYTVHWQSSNPRHPLTPHPDLTPQESAPHQTNHAGIQIGRWTICLGHHYPSAP